MCMEEIVCKFEKSSHIKLWKRFTNLSRLENVGGADVAQLLQKYLTFLESESFKINRWQE